MDPTEKTIATKHGIRRVRERLNLPARAAERMAEQAFREGTPVEAMPTWMQHYVAEKKRGNPSTIYRYFRGFMFVFGPGNTPEEVVLVTTYSVRETTPDSEVQKWAARRRENKHIPWKQRFRRGKPSR